MPNQVLSSTLGDFVQLGELWYLYQIRLAVSPTGGAAVLVPNSSLGSTGGVKFNILTLCLLIACSIFTVDRSRPNESCRESFHY